MTKEEILLYCIYQAVRGGFNAGEFRKAFERSPMLPNGKNMVVNALSENPGGLIYNHLFLKGFFGDKDAMAGPIVIGKEWEQHARRMVVLPDPLRYLEKYLIAPSRIPGEPEQNA